MNEISIIISRPESTIRYYLSKGGIKVIENTKKSKVINLLDNGFSKKEILKMLNVSKGTIKSAFRYWENKKALILN